MIRDTHTLWYEVGPAHSSGGCIWYVMSGPRPEVRGPGQETCITDDVTLTSSWLPPGDFQPAQPLLTSLYHLFLFGPISNLAVEGNQVIGQTS